MGKGLALSILWGWFIKLMTQFTPNLMYTIIILMAEHLEMTLERVCAVSALWWLRNNWKGCNLWFLNIVVNTNHTIHFKFGIYTFWVILQKLFDFGLPWHNFASLVAQKLMKMVVIDAFWLLYLWFCHNIHHYPPSDLTRGGDIFSLMPCYILALYPYYLNIGAIFRCHYNDVIMSAMASQITSLTFVYSTV